MATDAKQYWAAELGEVVAKVVKTKEQLLADAAKGTPFASLDGDATSGFYTVTRTGGADIRYRSAEKDFEGYSGGKTVDTAVREAINGLDLTGSISLVHSRHDFQPSGAIDHNLQVQLGGSRDYRVGVGDTSSTLVVVNVKLWDAMVAANRNRWKRVIQAAHTESFANTSKIEIRPPA